MSCSSYHAVFSVATNGYERHFKACIDSQRDYCSRINVPYYLIAGSPPWGISAHDSAWMKLSSLNCLLKRFSGGVLYLDADCEVMPNAPDFRFWDQEQPSKALFAAYDFSQRLNAAVIYCRGNQKGRSLVSRLAWSAFLPDFLLPRADRNLYENGHFIWLCKDNPSVHVIPNQWNAGTYSNLMNPFFFHHGGTVMRDASGERPLDLRTRIFASWVGLRLPFHLAWYRKCLLKPLSYSA